MRWKRLPSFGPAASRAAQEAPETPETVAEALEMRGRRRQRRTEDPEELFALHCRMFGLPDPERQFRFARELTRRSPTTGKLTPRQWRFDFAWPQYLIAVEIEGLVMVRITDPATVRKLGTRYVVLGGHASPAGIRRDMQKYNAAALLGWYVLRFDQDDVASKRAVEMTLRVLAARGWHPPYAHTEISPCEPCS